MSGYGGVSGVRVRHRGWKGATQYFKCVGRMRRVGRRGVNLSCFILTNQDGSDEGRRVWWDRIERVRVRLGATEWFDSIRFIPKEICSRVDGFRDFWRVRIRGG